MSGLMQSDLATRLQTEGAPVGEIFSFISGLYFRGKLAYSQKFAKVTDGVWPGYVITASAGLIPCETLVSGCTKSAPVMLISPTKNIEVLLTAMRMRFPIGSEQIARSYFWEA